jgi:hypothetical protein
MFRPAGMIRRMGMCVRLGIGLLMAWVLCVAGRGNCAAASWQGETAQGNGQEGKTNQQGAVPEYSMGGVVVDTVSGKGLGHVLVEVSPEGRMGEGQPVTRRVMTDEEGRFEVRGLTTIGRAGLFANKPGYHMAQEVRTGLGRRMTPSQQVRMEPGAEVTVKMTPWAGIAGRVVDESGEPIEGLPIHLMFEAALEGKRILEERSEFVDTDAEGEFRVGPVPTGRYYVAAGPSYEGAVRKGAATRTTMGYPVMFYGGGSDPATASPVDLPAGKHADLDLRMELQPLFKVRGFTSGGVTGNPPKIWIFNAANQRVGDLAPSNPEHEFLIAELPRGSYTIHASSGERDANECVAASRRLNLTKDVSGLQLALAPCATITVNVHAEHTKPEANKKASPLDENGSVRSNLQYLSQVMLRPKDERGNFPRYYASSDKSDAGKAVLRGVEPGRYSIEMPMMRGVYIESMQSGMTDLLREDLVVAPGAAVAPIEVRVRDDAAMLDGKVKMDADVTAAAVIAIPEGMPKGARTIVVVDGQYHFPPLAPGRYQVLAVDRVDDFAYAEPDVMGRFAAHAKDVTLRPNERTALDLELVRVGREEHQ